MIQHTTLCLIHEHPRILLGMKKRGFGAGRWNGFGGKVQAGEGIEDAARREMLEESGVTVDVMEKAGLLDFHFPDDPVVIRVHVFRLRDFSGEPREGEEMKPQWFDAANLPFDAMWPDDSYWMPLFLAGKRFRGSFRFGHEDSIVDYTLAEADERELYGTDD